MQLLSTAFALVALFGCVWCAWVAVKQAYRAGESNDRCDIHATKLFQERARVTVLEREVDALRRELRKLAGKFYASVREKEETDDKQQHELVSTAPLCDNYALAQREGPFSKAAKCECQYCSGRRAQKAAYRASEARAGHLDPTWIKAHAGGVVDAGEN